MKRTIFYYVAETSRGADGACVPARIVTGRCSLSKAKEVQRALGSRYAVFETTIYGEATA